MPTGCIIIGCFIQRGKICTRAIFPYLFLILILARSKRGLKIYNCWEEKRGQRDIPERSGMNYSNKTRAWNVQRAVFINISLVSFASSMLASHQLGYTTVHVPVAEISYRYTCYLRSECKANMYILNATSRYVRKI